MRDGSAARGAEASQPKVGLVMAGLVPAIVE